MNRGKSSEQALAAVLTKHSNSTSNHNNNNSQTLFAAVCSHGSHAFHHILPVYTTYEIVCNNPKHKKQKQLHQKLHIHCSSHHGEKSVDREKTQPKRSYILIFPNRLVLPVRFTTI